MRKYWIETEHFAASTVPLAPDQYARFYGWCVSKEKECNEFSETDCHDLIIFAYTQEWERPDPNEEEVDFWQKVKDDEQYLIDRHPHSYTLVRIFPEEAIKEPSHNFVKKKVRYQRIIEGRASVKKSAEADWNLLNEFLDLAEGAQDKLPPVESANTDSRHRDTVEPVPEPPVEEMTAVNVADAPQSVGKTQNKPRKKSKEELDGIKMVAVKFAIKHPEVFIKNIEEKYELAKKSLSRPPYRTMIKNGRTTARRDRVVGTKAGKRDYGECPNPGVFRRGRSPERSEDDDDD